MEVDESTRSTCLPEHMGMRVCGSVGMTLFCPGIVVNSSPFTAMHLYLITTRTLPDAVAVTAVTVPESILCHHGFKRGAMISPYVGTLCLHGSNMTL